MSLVIVVPMAGLGSRFTKEGYSIPKPLIPVKGKLMVERVLDSFSQISIDAQYVLIVRKDFLDNWNKEIEFLKEKYKAVILYVDRVTQGAACSVLVGREFFKNKSLLIADSDTFYTDKVIKDFISFIEKKQLEQSVLTFKSDKDCFSYIKIEDGVVDVVEKEVISNQAISGIYYFRQGNDFIDETIDAMIYGDRDKSEYYISKIFNNAAKKKNSDLIRYFEISDKDIFCTGTPQQLIDVENRLG